MGRPLIDLTGQIFGRWTVVSHGEIRRTVHFWLCKCSCELGTEKLITGMSLKIGHSKSCGCITKELKTTHDMSQTCEYTIWECMRARCSNPNNSRYENYMARGITVCERWQNSFENFFEDMGPRPSKDHSVERVDNDGNYCKENCRWADRFEQGKNKRNNKWLTHNGRTLIAAEWGRELGISAKLIRRRLSEGWSDYDALFTPPRSGKRI